jgi:hypothetical protein
MDDMPTVVGLDGNWCGLGRASHTNSAPATATEWRGLDDDLAKVVGVSLGSMPMSVCTSADTTPSDGRVRVSEIVESVRGALYGCNCTGQPVVFRSTFEAIQKQIFERRGCTSTICHGGPPFQGGLDLRPDVAYENIFEKPSTEVDMPLITPGARDRSYLYMKLAAATDPAQLNGFQIVNAPMPNGLEPLSKDELEVVRLWIYNGAPKTGTIQGTDTLLGACLPPVEPISIDPLPPPAVDEGIQLELPPWLLRAQSEFEGCFATYYDFTEQVPAEFKDPTGEFFRWSGCEVRQDPQSHHLLLYFSPLNLQPGGLDVHDKSFGSWSCSGGEHAGEVCEPKDIGFCGEGVCASELKPSFACVGFGPPSARPAEITGGAPQAQTNFRFPAGVYQQLPLKGVMYWNTHAFNITTKDHTMNGRVNYYFAKPGEQDDQACRISDFSAIFNPHNPPFTKETYCNDHVFPIGARVFQMFGHNHKHGEHFWANDPNGNLIYDNYSYSDPVIQVYDPPLAYDSAVKAERTVRYCATYNNGVAPDGSPDIELVTRASRVPQSAQEFIGKCTPVACVAGKVAAACTKDADCDSSEGAGDGWCDACPITGGESTQNEMFVLFGAFYVDPSVPNADLSCQPYPAQ